MSFLSHRDVNGDPLVLKVTDEPSDNFTATQSNVTTTSALLVAANANRRRVTIRNLGASATVYISGTSPATTTHFPIFAGETLSDFAYSGAIYAIASAGTVAVAVIEEFA